MNEDLTSEEKIFIESSYLVAKVLTGNKKLDFTHTLRCPEVFHSMVNCLSIVKTNGCSFRSVFERTIKQIEDSNEKLMPDIAKKKLLKLVEYLEYLKAEEDIFKDRT